MSQTIDAAEVRQHPGRAADVAAQRAGVVVQLLHDRDEQRVASRLFDTVWSTDGAPLLPDHLQRALVHAGNYLAGAWADDRMVGAVLGFLGQQDGRLYLHSHLLGIDEHARRRGIGFALKQHQRAWALAHGLGTVSWTYDPLVGRNAYFNLSKLGAAIVDYHSDFYGAMPDGVNQGDESDRVLVAWDLEGDRAVAASQGRLPVPSVALLRGQGAEVALDRNAFGGPTVSAHSGPVALCRVPGDIVALRTTSPALARSWRRALREVFVRALEGGYTATGMTTDGWYILERPASAPS